MFKRSPLLTVLLLASCSSAPPSEAQLEYPQGVEVSLDRFLGTGLTGPWLREPQPVDGSELVMVRFELLLLERFPKTELRSLALQSVFIADPGEHSPLKPASVMAGEAVIGRGEEAVALRASLEQGAAGLTRVLFSKTVALPIGGSAALETRALGIFSAREFSWRPDPPVEAIPQSFSVLVTRMDGGGALQLLTDLRGALPRLDYEADQDEAREPLPPQPINERMAGRRKWKDLTSHEEFAISSGGVVVDGGGVVLLGHSPFDLARRRGVALFIEASSDTSALTPEDLSALNEELASQAAAALLAVSEEETALSRNRTLVRALDQLTPSSEGRRIMAVLASSIGAQLCNDFAMVADEQLFGALAVQLHEEAQSLLTSTTPEELAWRLERDAYALLATLDPDGGLPDELAGVLLKHAGEVGRYPSSIEEAILISSDLESFQRYLLEENRVFLEDPDPSSRVRAHDWLLLQGVVLPDYNPLAPAKERRAALMAYEDALAEGGSGDE